MLRHRLPSGAFAAVLFLFPALCSAQSISIVSGNGQMICPGCIVAVGTRQVLAPMIVQVNGANGSPLADTPVTWSVSAAGIAPFTANTTTGTNGQASYTQPIIEPTFGESVLPVTITATATAVKASVGFVSTSLGATSEGASPVLINLSPIDLPPPLSGAAGQPSATVIQVQVYLLTGVGVPNVAVQLTSGGAQGTATVSCMTGAGQEAGTVLTNTTGGATCNPVFGLIGTGFYTVTIGGTYASFSPAPLTVTAGPPAIIKIVSGNNQSVNPGGKVPAALVAEVTDLGGNPSDGAQVAWTVSPAGSFTLSNLVTSSGANGQVSANATGGSAGGLATVTVSLVSNSAVKVAFSLTVNVVFTALDIVSGNNQSVQIDQPFPDPLVVQVNDGTTAVSGATVSFKVVSGTATLSAASVVTGSNGQASVTATAGATIGTIAITATVGSGIGAIVQTFNLNALQVGPKITGIANAAGFQANYISPCSLATISGTGLATGIQGYVSYFLVPPMQMAGVTVTFAGASAPILNVVNQGGQESVSVQVPCDVVPGPAVPLVVTVNGGSTTTSVNVDALSPGVFQIVMSDGLVHPVMLRPDGSVVSIENPARLGETTRMYVTGLGQTTPALSTDQFVPLVPDPTTGDLIPQILSVNLQVVVGVNNSGLVLLSAQYAYGMVGVYELTFQMPAQAPTGNDVPFEIFQCQDTQCDKVVYGNATTVPLQP